MKPDIFYFLIYVVARDVKFFFNGAKELYTCIFV